MSSLMASFVSGSSFVLNRKLVDALLHTLVSDSTNGYGIFIRNMMDEAEEKF